MKKEVMKTLKGIQEDINTKLSTTKNSSAPATALKRISALKT